MPLPPPLTYRVLTMSLLCFEKISRVSVDMRCPFSSFFLGSKVGRKSVFVVKNEKHNIFSSRFSAYIGGDVPLASFCPEGFVGIGVPIGTDAFVQNFVAKACRTIIDDVEKLDAIQDGFIHYQLLRFCQATRLQYINSHILLGNRCVLQQQHVDCKIADALLKKEPSSTQMVGTRLVRPGRTWSSTCHMLRVVLV